MFSRISHRLRTWNIPFAITATHRYPFGEASDLLKDGELNSPESWDALRLAHPHFVIPDERDAWLKGLSEPKDGQGHGLEDRAVEIARLAIQRNISTICSVGVGGGALEFFIKQVAPQIRMVASDYNPLGVERLKRVFTECDEIRLFDVTARDWSGVISPNSTSLVLMYRVEPHFSDRVWRAIFENLAHSKIQNVLYMPSTILNVHYLIMLRSRNLKARLAGDKPRFSGYVRTEKSFQRMWRGLYDAERLSLNHMIGYWLRFAPGQSAAQSAA